MKPILNYILIIALIFGVSIFADNYMTVGFTTTGISKLDFTGHDSILNDDVWAIEFVQSGLSQHIYGSMAANSQDTTGGVEKTSKGFSIDITKSEEYCEYPIKVDYDTIPIYKVDYIKDSIFGTTLTNFKNECNVRAGGSSNVISYYKPFGYTYYCLYRVPQSSKIATFNDDSLKFNTDFNVKIDDKIYTKSISTTQSLVKFSDVAYIKWIGNLNSGDSCPDPSETRRAALINDNWKIIGTENYDTYKNYYKTKTELTSYVSESELITIVDKNNYNANRALYTKTFTGMYGEKAFTEGNNLNDGKVRINLNNFIQFPSYVAYISADDVKGIGVYQPVATPKIISVDDLVFKTGNTGYVTGEIKNIGNERGSFETSIKCDSGISMTGTSFITTLEPEQSQQITIPITGQTTTGAECILTTKTLDKSDSMAFNVDVNTQQLCTPNTEICLDGVGKVCNIDGTEYIDDGNNKRCEPLINENNWMNKLSKMIFGDNFGVEDIIPILLTIGAIIIGSYVFILALPTLLPLVVKFIFAIFNSIIKFLFGRK